MTIMFIIYFLNLFSMYLCSSLSRDLYHFTSQKFTCFSCDDDKYRFLFLFSLLYHFMRLKSRIMFKGHFCLRVFAIEYRFNSINPKCSNTLYCQLIITFILVYSKEGLLLTELIFYLWIYFMNQAWYFLCCYDSIQVL